jgi:hypothetical protein
MVSIDEFPERPEYCPFGGSSGTYQSLVACCFRVLGPLIPNNRQIV